MQKRDAYINRICAKAQLSTISVSLLLLALYEIISYFVSGYQANSILFLRAFLLIMCCIFVIDTVLQHGKYKTHIVVFISLLAGLLALLNLPIFFFRYFEAGMYGFNDFTQFRFLYTPLGLLSNEWVSIMLCFLPFPLMALLQFWKKKVPRYGFLFIIGVVIFNILISFSRGGILAFLLFILLLNILFLAQRLVAFKKLLFANLWLSALLVFFSLCFFQSVQSTVRQTASHQRSTEGRLKQWGQAEGAIDAAPYFGVGAKNYMLLGRPLPQPDLEYSPSGRVNNTFIQLLIEKGWIGFSIWAAVIGFFLCHTFLRMRKGENKPEKIIDCIILSGVCAILCRELFFSSLLYNDWLLLLFFILLILNPHSAHKAVLSLKRPMSIAIIALLLSATAYFHFAKPNNALSYATKGLNYGRAVEPKPDSVLQAIQNYQRACQLSPSDAMFHHNLGQLYLMRRQPDSALLHLSQAVRLEPNVALYQISLGSLIEDRQAKEAFEYYKQAILLSPDIVDAPFFADLSARDSLRTQALLQEASQTLLQLLSVRYSPVLEAKNGKILLALGQPERAYEALTHVTQILPNLSRPWYYLGDYKKSSFLSPNDHLPLYALVHYHKAQGEQAKADTYYKIAERVRGNRTSAHSALSKKMYYLATEKDDVLPKGLLDYITPVFKGQAIVAQEDSTLIAAQLFLKNNMSDKEFKKLLSNNANYSYVKDVARAVEQYKKDDKGVSFEDFCEYVLPPFLYNEKMEDWRSLCYTEFAAITAGLDINQICGTVNATIANGFVFNTAAVRQYRNWTALNAKKGGDCSVMTQVVIYPLRSLGYATAVDYVVAWGNINGRHYWNAVLDNGRWEPFMGLEHEFGFNPFTGGRAAKVFRRTFSINREYLNISKQLTNPRQASALFADFRFKDVSSEYFPTVDVVVQCNNETDSVLFLNVFNKGRWTPIAAALPAAQGLVSFNDIKADILYIASNPNLRDLHYTPFTLKEDGEPVYFNPSPNEFESIDIELADPESEADYQLYYYDAGWQKLATAKAQNTTLHFERIPKNALLLLKDSKGKIVGRPFTVEEGTKRSW